jgi:hypothetical protein
MQTAAWKDYLYGSWLVLVFGQIHCKLVALDGPAATATEFGLLFSPQNSMQFKGTLLEAKAFAEIYLKELLTTALGNLEKARDQRIDGRNPEPALQPIFLEPPGLI